MIFSLANIFEINLYAKVLRWKMAEDDETWREYGEIRGNTLCDRMINEISISYGNRRKRMEGIFKVINF